jgi:nitrous oxidase accessory protein NosD
MRNRLTWSAIVLLMYVCPLPAATQYVGTCHKPSSVTINDAVKIAATGDVIKVCPGSYVEQVIISKSLTLEGMTSNGQGLVEVSNPEGPETTTSTVTGYALTPIIWVVGASVNISNILVGGYFGGDLCENITPVSNIGVGFYYGNGSSGTLNNAASNISCGAGVWLENSSDLGGGTVEVENSVIWGDLYGIFAGGGPHQTGTIPLLRATITGNQVEHAQYGIYIADIGGTVSNNVIAFPGFPTAPVYPYGPSVGLSDAAPDAVVTGNRITQEITGINILTANVFVTSNHIQSAGATAAGIDLHCFLGNVSNNMLQIRGGSEENYASFGIADVPAGFTLVNHFYNTTNLQSSGSC